MKSLSITGETVKNNEAKTEYEVNVLLGLCTCYVGKEGAPCKHQHYVIIRKQLDSKNIVPITETQKKRFHFIATGNEDVREDWYKSWYLVLHLKKRKKKHLKKHQKPLNT